MKQEMKLQSVSQNAPAMDLVRERAYQIWLDEGMPEGRALEHWVRAENEVSTGPGRQDQGQGRRGPRSQTDGARPGEKLDSQEKAASRNLVGQVSSSEANP